MSASELYERIRFRSQPGPHPDAVVTRGDVRVTVLTSRLLRLEWSETGEFEDRATYAFPTRWLTDVPPHSVRQDGGILTVDTGDLMLTYKLGAGRFDEENLEIRFKLEDEPRTWHPGLPDAGNLRGTRRTLDRCAGDASLEIGLLSRDGWALFDDTRNVVFGEDGWVAPRPDFELQDWDFFGYGHAYTEALRDYMDFGGDIPLVPTFTLGNWWSRYWAYSAQDLRDLVAQFEAHDVPLDVFVIDMDWHTPDSWTGYTWNRELFPDPPAFLRWLHNKGLRVTLNLHPAEGVQAFEEAYEAFAQAMGIDAASGDPVPFLIADKAFVRHYFEILHHPLEDQGVDFWWMDWQQGEISEVKGLDPLPWINHLHFNDSRRRNSRPMLYSRWGGLGNHRYPIGFSGDTYVTWDALQFQPYMTATAANVLYGWWSHDIGGHMGGSTEPELYARWVQFGALSPVLRLHATKDPRAERRPWAYAASVYEAAKAAIHWRYRLVPYLYTAARIAADTGVSLCRPMYYETPKAEGAYAARYQYYLGDQMIAAPIVFPADAETEMARSDVWLPSGTWIAYDTLETYEGPGWIRIVGDLERMPMLMKAGAILPLAADFVPPVADMLTSGTTDAQPDDALVLTIFPGEGAFDVYRDDGTTEAYRNGAYEWLPVRSWQTNNGLSWVATIGPTVGRCETLPDRCDYEVRLVGSHRPVGVLVDGQPAEWRYDAEGLTTVVKVPRLPKTGLATVTATAEVPIVALGEQHNRRCRAADVARVLGDQSRAGTSDLDALLAAETGTLNRQVQDAVALLGGPFTHVIELVTLEEATEQLGRLIIAAPQDGNPVGVTVDFTLDREGEIETQRVSYAEVDTDLVIDVPFAFDGVLARQQWRAELRLTWQGHVLQEAYASDFFFPGIYRWHAAVYDRNTCSLALEEVLAAYGAEDADVDFDLLVQDPATAHNLKEPFALRLWEHYGERQEAGEALGAFLLVTVHSREARQAILQFVGNEEIKLVVNGEGVVIEASSSEEEVPAHFPLPRRSAPFALRRGDNVLAVHTVAPETEGDRWFFAGRLLTPEGVEIHEITFS